MLRFLAVVIVLLSSMGSARAERLVTEISSRSVEITSGFDGERLVIFGTVEPDTPESGSLLPERLEMVVTIIGPTQRRVTRLKSNTLGFWLNTDQVAYPELPGFFKVLASARLDKIAERDLLVRDQILPDAFLLSGAPGRVDRTAAFAQETLRILSGQGLYGQIDYGVQFLSDRLYSAQIQLPSDAPPGAYVVRTYAFRDGKIVARTSKGFSVRKVAFERFVDHSAQQWPLLYGLSCVAVAVLTGWSGGLLFRR